MRQNHQSEKLGTSAFGFHPLVPVSTLAHATVQTVVASPAFVTFVSGARPLNTPVSIAEAAASTAASTAVRARLSAHDVWGLA